MKKIQLSIPEPCQENWDAMTPTQQGRYCNTCSKEVIDFSNMSDSEVLNYFLEKKTTEHICGSVYPDQLGRYITASPQKKSYWQWRYIFTAFLFFMKPGRSAAQGKVVSITADTVYSTCNTSAVKKDGNQKRSISGIVTDEKGKPVAFATVKIKGTSNGSRTGEDGCFVLTSVQTGKSLEVSAIGYETKTVIADNSDEYKIALINKTELMPETVIYSTVCRRRMGLLQGMAVQKVTITDTVKNWVKNFNPSIKIYPGPVIKGSTFTIAMKLKQAGDYTIQVMNTAGQIITEKKITSTSKEWKEQLTAGNTWSAGMYYVKVMNEEKRLLTTGSVIVQ